jgi:hypothetical protein
MRKHLEEETGLHLEMMKKAFDSQTELLRDQFDTQLKVQTKYLLSLFFFLLKSSFLFPQKLRDERIRQLERQLADNGRKLFLFAFFVDEIFLPFLFKILELSGE